MEKLNELVEQAKEMSQIHGSEWDNALSKYPDGAIQFEVVSTKGETIVTTGRDKNADSWLCDYLVLCSPANILTIAEAFRDLEQEVQKNLEGALAWQQRAEAAEAQVEAEINSHRKHAAILISDRGLLRDRAEAAEAKLAELERQEPFEYLTFHQGCRAPDDCEIYCVVAEKGDKSDDGSDAFPVYSRPAPAVSLTELVPKKKITDTDCAYYPLIKARNDGYNLCVDDILRNIEEAK